MKIICQYSMMKNNLVSPRPSKLTLGQLLLVISSHLISPCFTCTHSSCLIHPPSHGLCSSLQALLVVNKDAQTDSPALNLVRQSAQGGTSG